MYSCSYHCYVVYVVSISIRCRRINRFRIRLICVRVFLIIEFVCVSTRRLICRRLLRVLCVRLSFRRILIIIRRILVCCVFVSVCLIRIRVRIIRMMIIIMMCIMLLLLCLIIRVMLLIMCVRLIVFVSCVCYCYSSY